MTSLRRERKVLGQYTVCFSDQECSRQRYNLQRCGVVLKTGQAVIYILAKPHNHFLFEQFFGHSNVVH